MNKVAAHYAQPGLIERVKDALRHSGLDPKHLSQSELGKLDQFHVGGANATDSLARLAEIRDTDRVLDIGSGVGGPSRHLASTVGCHVTGLDLTDEYCQVANMLALATGLSHLVDYRQGDALHAPFANATFDVVWTQHASMNIAEKGALYREIFRLLKPGGRFAFHDIVAGTGDLRYPVPWASRAELSFLISEPDAQKTLTAEGFRNIAWQDATEEGLEALRKAPPSGPGFGIRTLIGPEFPTMIANLVANLQNGACRLVQAAYTKV
jgi:SAM-dependent methyltransferase